MLRLRPYNKNDAEIIMSWIKGENAFYKWTAGVLGEYPISAEQFNMVSNLMAFTAIDDNEISLGVFENNESAYYCYKAIGFEDVSQDEIEKYTVMGEEWNCLELEMKL